MVSCESKHVGVGIIQIIMELPYTLSIVLGALLKVNIWKFQISL